MLLRCARTLTSSIFTMTSNPEPCIRSPARLMMYVRSYRQGPTLLERERPSRRATSDHLTKHHYIKGKRSHFMSVTKIVETAYGTVDAHVLAELQGSFATSDLLVAVDTIQAREARQKWLRGCLLRLHAMASHLINGTPQTVTGQEPIWQLAEEIGDELDAYTANLAHAAKLVDRLARLRPNDDSTADMRR